MLEAIITVTLIIIVVSPIAVGVVCALNRIGLSR